MLGKWQGHPGDVQLLTDRDFEVKASHTNLIVEDGRKSAGSTLKEPLLITKGIGAGRGGRSKGRGVDAMVNTSKR